MKEENWSIRKMREQQKGSLLKNTYKSKVIEKNNEDIDPKPSSNEEGSGFFNRIRLFLEE